MIYTLKNDNFKSFSRFCDNKNEGRAYFIPFSSRQKAEETNYLEARYKSDMVKCLSGEWDFKFYLNPDDMPETFDTDTASFDKVPVPSCWQFTGYMQPMYLNAQYPFPCNPPIIPESKLEPYKLGGCGNNTQINPKNQYNSAGVYRTFFRVDDTSFNYTLSFLGVCASLDLYVNGKYVGYSEGSHNTAEFAVGNYIELGENEIVAVVRRWSTGSYLECQDMFRNNGIFRDVLLYVTPSEFIRDFKINTEKKDDKYNLFIDVAVENPSKGIVTAELIVDGKSLTVVKPATNNVMIDFYDLNVKEWSAEIPVLYDLYISISNEQPQFIHHRLGFKTIEIKNPIFYFNGAKIKMKGVNHHDTNPETGYVLTTEDIIRDISLMKEFNVNTVRTSHYPPDPVFLQAASEYGLYIIDEADIETHGMDFSARGINGISDNLEWKEHYIDRVKRMYLRDRNNVCITMWSLGNESGGIKCQDYCYNYLKSVSDIPVHYEAACRSPRQSYDVVSEMYTSPNTMRLRVKWLSKCFMKKRRNKPYFLCEYAHAMGVGPGSFKEYMELFYSDDRYLGGCVWEWADHAVYHKDGKYRFTYGGDHGEYTHDGNFCVDGLIYPDRRPSTSAFAMKAAYRPIIASYYDGKIVFHNTNRFRYSDYITISVSLSIEGKIEQTEKYNLNIAPDSDGSVPFPAPKSGDTFINIEYIDKYAGEKIATEQLILSEQLPPLPVQNGKVDFTENQNTVTVTFEGGQAVFDKMGGTLTNYVYNKVEYLNQNPINRYNKSGFITELFRAPTDNDRNVVHKWRKAGYDKYSAKNINFISEKCEDKVSIVIKYTLDNNSPLFDVKDEYEIYGDGLVTVKSTLTPLCSAIDLPRIGKTVELSSAFKDITYYGRGELENYPDFLEQSIIGVYQTKYDVLPEYIRPQESGNHCDMRFASLTDGKNGITFLATDQPFNFNAKPYSIVMLDSWAHTEDIVKADAVCINIDGFMGGIGSNSCGPRALKQYLIKVKKGCSYTYSFAFLPTKVN